MFPTNPRNGECISCGKTSIPGGLRWFSHCLLGFLFWGCWLAPVLCQTDETIFREFQFDFSTPGARANGMGRAFVGLADEATAAYNNPAGISVLRRPQFSIEGRLNHNEYNALKDTGFFDIIQGEPEDTDFDLNRIGFASYAFSSKDFNFSFFFVNNLDYRRDPVQDNIRFQHTQEFYTTTYLNQHEVRQIRLNTFGFSVSRDFGRLDLGVAVALAGLKMDFEYQTNLDSFDLFLSDLVASNADEESHKMVYVLGALYQIHPKLKVGLSYKIQPKFVYTEHINNSDFPPPQRQPIPITFKVPDSFQLGLAWQPNDFWTLLLDVDWIQYRQLVGRNMTTLSRLNTFPPGDEPIFSRDDYDIEETPEVHMGAEYLIPLKKNILALRFGGFLDPDHKTRFIGTTESPFDRPLYDIQRFIYNTDAKEDNVGFTLGLGFVWNDKLQWDIALVQSDRFRRVLTSFLYRF